MDEDEKFDAAPFELEHQTKRRKLIKKGRFADLLAS